MLELAGCYVLLHIGEKKIPEKVDDWIKVTQ